jgi:hypothetical protein
MSCGDLGWITVVPIASSSPPSGDSLIGTRFPDASAHQKQAAYLRSIKRTAIRSLAFLL